MSKYIHVMRTYFLGLLIHKSNNIIELLHHTTSELEETTHVIYSISLGNCGTIQFSILVKA